MTPPAPGSARLVDHPDFQQLVTIAAGEIGLLPVWVEKDYWLVRVLEALVRSPALAGRFVFKGGTSLSKAWRLIERFSEDIDLLLTGENHGPMPTTKGDREKVFKAVRGAIEEATPLRLPLEGLTEEAKKQYYFRSDNHGYMRYPLRAESLAARAGSDEWLLVEAGFRGGSQPWTVVPICSYVGEHIAARPELSELAAQYAADIVPVKVPVLGAERTFVEKLLAVHAASVGDLSNLQGRHFYDLSKLHRHPDVIRCLDHPDEFRSILGQAIAVSNAHWRTNLDPKVIDLAFSPALGPSPEVANALARRWADEETLYPRGQPPLSEVLDELANLRERLRGIRPPGL
jgi:hypothetical protein